MQAMKARQRLFDVQFSAENRLVWYGWAYVLAYLTRNLSTILMKKEQNVDQYINFTSFGAMNSNCDLCGVLSFNKW